MCCTQVAHRPRGIAQSPRNWQPTSGTDTGGTVTGAGTNYIGGNYKQCTFATTTLTDRLTGAFSTTLAPMPGAYRALLRGVLPNGVPAIPNPYQFRLEVLSDGGSGWIPGDLVSIDLYGRSGADSGCLIDLGLFLFPVFGDSRPIGFEAAATSVRPVSVRISAASPTGTDFRFDELYLLPVETSYGSARMACVSPPAYNASIQYNAIIFDGTSESLRSVYDASGTAPFPVCQRPSRRPDCLWWIYSQDT